MILMSRTAKFDGSYCSPNDVISNDMFNILLKIKIRMEELEYCYNTSACKDI